MALEEIFSNVGELRSRNN